MIHPTAVIDPRAEIDPSCDIGPYAIIDAHVVLGAECWVGPHVHVTGHTTIGRGNRFHAGCVIGEAPQDFKYKNEPTRLTIGEGNVFREHVTVHRSNQLAEATTIGSNNLFMVHSHVGHNSAIGNHVVIANGAMLGGHVAVEDRAFISGNCLVHQFTRIGTLALMQGGAGISKDLPPYTVARGDNGICGLNTVGLKRAGFTSEQRLELKRLYHRLFRRADTLQSALAAVEAEFASATAQKLIQFVRASKRGVCADVGRLADPEPE